jgi:uncharacterized protein (TIGR03435 family)
MKVPLWLPALAAVLLLVPAAAAQSPAFGVATIRPTVDHVNFEKDGATQISPGSLHMRDVTLDTCIKWAYNVQEAQVAGPDALRSDRYDIQAKADGPATDDQMRLMFRQLLADRFKLDFHRETKVMRAYALTVLPTGQKLHESAPDTPRRRENTAVSTIAKSISMPEFANFLADAVETPVVDQTNLKDRYDFVLDFTPYLPVLDRPLQLHDFLEALQAALEGELGLKLERLNKTAIEVLVVDHVEKPSES